jgi:hypothetical protein
LSLSEYEKVVFGTSPGCMRVCMYVRFPVAWTAGLILFVFIFKSLSIIMSVHREYEHSRSKSRGPKTQNFDLLEYGCNYFLFTFKWNCRGDGIFTKVMVPPLMSQTSISDFLENDCNEFLFTFQWFKETISLNETAEEMGSSRK